MTIETRLAEVQARVGAATEGPWTALGSGVASGDHWHVIASSEAVAHISSRDGVNEDQREPDAEFIANARTDVPWLLGQVELRDKALEAVMDLHQSEPHCNNARHTNPDVQCPECAEYCTADGEQYPCLTITALTAALEVEG